MDPRNATGAFKLIVSGNGSFSPRMWERLIQARANRLKQEFDHLPLPAFGSLKEGGSMHQSTIEQSTAVITGNGGLTFRTRGIFGVAEIERVGRFDSVTKKFWGFTEKGAWVIADIRRSEMPPRNAFEICIRRVTLKQLIRELANSPEEIWEHLGGTAREWFKRTSIRYRRAKRLVREQSMEGLALSAIQRR